MQCSSARTQLTISVRRMGASRVVKLELSRVLTAHTLCSKGLCLHLSYAWLQRE
jgi:hypothetical protein